MILAMALVALVVPDQMLGREAGALLRAASAGDLSDIGRAVTALERLRGRSPDNPAILQRLAEAYSLAGRHADALAALEEAFRLQPKNLLIWQQLARAYEATGDTAAADALWAGQGLGADRLVQLARSSAADGDYAAATAWYRRALRAGLPADDLHVQREVVLAAAMLGQPLPAELEGWLAPVLRPAAAINGGDLIWMPERASAEGYGRPLNAYPSDDLIQGVLWWVAPAVAFIEVERAGDYELLLRARHRPSPGGQLSVTVDSTEVDVLTLGTEWQDYRLPLRLQPGTHMLRLYYPVDVGDAIVRSISLNPITK